jgi:hypothetical protein
MDERKLDANATGGLLVEVFALKMTTAEVACTGCGATDE